MVQGDRSVIDIDAMLRAAALAPLSAPCHRTGEVLAGFERLDIPSGLWTAEDAVGGKDVLAARTCWPASTRKDAPRRR